MSTKEIAYRIIDSFSDEQLEGFVLLFKDYIPSDEEHNEETRTILDDVKNGRNLSRNVTVEELFEDMNS